MTHYRAIKAFLLTQLPAAMFMLLSGLSQAHAATVTAQPVLTFLRSLGMGSICITTASPLATGQCGLTIAQLTYLGVYGLRISIDSESSLKNALAIHAGAPKVRIDMLTHLYVPVSSYVGWADRLIAANAYLMCEGRNEYPGSLDWLLVAQYQRDLWKAMHTTPPSWPRGGYLVAGPSQTGAENGNYAVHMNKVLPGFGDPAKLAAAGIQVGTVYSDALNEHNYVSGNFRKLVPNQAWNAASKSAHFPGMNDLWGNHVKTWAKGYDGYSNPGAPLLETQKAVMTENNWLIAKPGDTLSTPTISGNLTERGHGVIMLNVLIDDFNRGWSNTFIFAMSERQWAQFGHFRLDDSPRPAAVYLHNLTGILQDTVVASGLKTIDYTLTGPDTLHHMLLQDRYGALYLVLTNERSMAPGGESDGGTDPIELFLPPDILEARIYDPTIGTEVQEILPNTIGSPIAFSMGDHPLVLKLK